MDYHIPMSEIVIVRSLDNPAEELPMDRELFYDDQLQIFKETGKPTKAVDVIAVFIFNANRELLIQKRSFDKRHNPGLLDKSVGGHIRYGDSPDYAVMVETVQELQTPSIVLRGKNDFEKTRALLKDYLEIVAIIEHYNDGIHILHKTMGGEKIGIANNLHIYFGLYNGRIRPVDREAKGVIWYSLEELKSEIQKFPETFSEDMYFFMKHFGEKLRDFTKKI